MAQKKTTPKKTARQKTTKRKPARGQAPQQEKLFDISSPLDTSSYSSKQVIGIIGITYRQLDHWDRINFIKPSGTKAKGSGSRRQYSYSDLLRFKIAKRLLDSGVSFPAVQKAFDYIEGSLKEDILTANLVIEGDRVSYMRDPQEIIDIMANGQGVLNFVRVPAISHELEAEIISLVENTPEASKPQSNTSQKHNNQKDEQPKAHSAV